GALNAKPLELHRAGPGDVEDEHFAVADAAGAGGADHLVGDLLPALLADPDADFDFGQKRHAVFAAKVTFQIVLLPAIALRFLHEASVDVQLVDGFQHRLGAKRTNEDGELFHVLVGFKSTTRSL